MKENQILMKKILNLCLLLKKLPRRHTRKENLVGTSHGREAKENTNLDLGHLSVSKRLSILV